MPVGVTTETTDAAPADDEPEDVDEPQEIEDIADVEHPS
jgi:hypothetical protein